MKVAIYRILDGLILRRVDAPPDAIPLQCHEGEEFFLNCPYGTTKIVDGEPVFDAPPAVVESSEKRLLKITWAVQQRLDEVARSRNYDNMLSLASYANSTNPKFKAEALAGIAWRDECWGLFYAKLATVGAGEETLPSVEEALALLPAMEWPVE